MSHGSDEGDNYWPGYVDALTSMVQVLAFVMMMLAMAVFVLSQSVSKKAVEAIAKAVNAEVKPNQDIKQLTQSIVEQIDRLRKSAPPPAAAKPEQTPAVKPPPSAEPGTRPDAEKPTAMRINGGQPQPNQAAINVPPDAPRQTIAFGDRSFRIEGDQAQSIAGFVDGHNIVANKQTIIINAYAYSGEGAISEARRLGYYRAMTARKLLVDAKVKPENIRINVNDTTDKDKGLTVDLIAAGGGAH
jgi:hypothetical protein